jgi:hypothetical protein
MRARAAAALLLAALASAAALAPRPARADLPSPELLEDLRQRLLAPDACRPECAASPRMLLDVSGDSLTLRVEVNAAAETAVPLPGGARDWVPERILVDGRPAPALWRGGEGALWLRLGPGTHQLILEGRLPPRDSVELPLPLRPRRVEARAEGWSVAGVAEDGTVEGALQLVPLREAGRGEAAGAAPDSLEPRPLPVFVTVERNLELGLAWQGTTRVERLSPADVAAVLEVPLLEGESVTTPGVRVQGGRALVSLAPGAREAFWTSLLPQGPDLRLSAPAAVPWSEVWRVEASPIWHVEASGIPAVQLEAAGRTREWRPWPGESVALSIERPEGVGGSTVTADAVFLETRPGLRASDATAQVVLRSSQGGPHLVRLPEGAELQSLTVDGTPQPVRQEGRAVTLTLVPGTQTVELVLREPRGIGRLFRGAELDLGLPSVNAHLRVAVPPSRWILAVGGPRLGPAVLFWPLLAVLVVVAFLLARLSGGRLAGADEGSAGRLTPLRFHHWLLLGVGLTQVPFPAAALVVVWLVALGWRERDGVRVPGRSFDLVQVGLVVLTAAALAVLFLSIERGLLGQPEMQIAGNGSSPDLLRWYQDRADPLLPRPWVLSAPILVYRLAMLAWALWIARALVGWLRWGWRCFSAGELWRPLRRPA